MEKELFDALVQSIKEMKEIQAGRLKPARRFIVPTPVRRKRRNAN